MNANAIDIQCHKLMLMVLRCKNTTERAALVFGTLKRKDTGDLQAAAARCIKAGLIQFGSTNASARAYSTSYAPVDALLYLTKAGKAWLRAQGNDFGSSKVTAHVLGLRKPVVTIQKTPALYMNLAWGQA